MRPAVDSTLSTNPLTDSTLSTKIVTTEIPSTDQTGNQPWSKQGINHNHGHNLTEWQRIAADLAGHLTAAHTQGICPNCMTTVNRYRAMRDGTHQRHDTTTTEYAGSREHRQ